MPGNFFNIILETNTFNFIVFVLIFAFIFKKIKLGDKISDMQKSTENLVKNSDEEKEKSKKALQEAQKQLSNVENERAEIIKISQKTARSITKKVVEQTQKQIEIIEKYTDKVVENDTQMTKKNLLSFAAKKALKITEEKLKKQLNKDLHQKYIDEAIDELEKISI